MSGAGVYKLVVRRRLHKGHTQYSFSLLPTWPTIQVCSTGPSLHKQGKSQATTHDKMPLNIVLQLMEQHVRTHFRF